MFIKRGMNKEDVVHTHIQWNITQSQKGMNWVICRDVDGPRDCHAE